MRKTKANVEHTMEAIVEVARDIFSKNGYTATNLQDIATALGTTRTPLYYHFKNKQQLYEKVVEDYLHIKDQDFLITFASEKDDIFEKTRRHMVRSCHYGIIEKALFMGIEHIKELEYVTKIRRKSSEYMYITKKTVVEEAIRNNELKKETNTIEFINYSYILYFGFMGMSSGPFFPFLENMPFDTILKLIDTVMHGMIQEYSPNPLENRDFTPIELHPLLRSSSQAPGPMITI